MSPSELTSSGNLPDEYDRQLGALHGLPDVVRTNVATVRHVPPLGIGGTQLFSIQTYRQRDRGDILFLEVAGSSGIVRVVLPPAVCNVIARQRDALTAKSRSKASKAVAEDRAARGLPPGFMKAEKGGRA